MRLALGEGGRGAQLWDTSPALSRCPACASVVWRARLFANTTHVVCSVRMASAAALSSAEELRNAVEQQVRAALRLPLARGAAQSGAEGSGDGSAEGSGDAPTEPDVTLPTDAERAAFSAFRESSLRSKDAKEDAKATEAALAQRMRSLREALLEVMQRENERVLMLPRALVDQKNKELAARGLRPLPHYVRLDTTRKPSQPISLELITQVVEAVTEAQITARYEELRATAQECARVAGSKRTRGVADADAAAAAAAAGSVRGRGRGRSSAGRGQSARGTAADAAATAPQPPPTVGDALVDLITTGVLGRIAGEVVTLAKLTNTLARGTRAYDVRTAPAPVVVNAVALHELSELRAQALAQRDVVVKECAARMAEHSAVITAFFERSGRSKAYMKNPTDESRKLYVVAPKRVETAQPVRVKLFRAVLHTAVTETFGDLRGIRDVATAMRAKQTLLDHIRAQIAGLPPRVKMEPPRLLQAPGRAAAAAEAATAAVRSYDEDGDGDGDDEDNGDGDADDDDVSDNDEDDA